MYRFLLFTGFGTLYATAFLLLLAFGRVEDFIVFGMAFFISVVLYLTGGKDA